MIWHLEEEEKVQGGHGAAAEEVLCHPVGLSVVLKVVREAAVHKDVDKEHPARPEPRGDALHEHLVVLHVLKHLDREHAVVCGGRLEGDHVVREDREVLDAALLGPEWGAQGNRISIMRQRDLDEEEEEA